MRGKRFGTSALVGGILLSLLVVMPATGMQGPPGSHLNITEVFVDFLSDTLEIIGEDFDFGGSLQVTLGEVGDITNFCTSPITPTPTLIVCDLSGRGLPPDGDYLLTVSTGNGPSRTDEYDLTIGAVGPVGPKGDTGATGPPGEDGEDGEDGDAAFVGLMCPPGQAVIGFDDSGNLKCVLASSLGDQVCVVANGLTWCFNNSACGEACNAVCAAAGLNPIASNATWLAAQDTEAECQAISQAFGLGTTVLIAPFNAACLEDAIGTHSVGGGLISPLACSTFSPCPEFHRTNVDLSAPCSETNSLRSICPCE